MNLNKVFILGNLTRDPELRQTPSGQTVVNFGVATNRMWNDQAGNKQTQVEYHNIVIWGRRAEVAKQYLNKGSLVLIEGRLATRTWQDQNGQKRSRTEIIADNMQLGPRLAQASNQSHSNYQPEKPTTPALPEVQLDELEAPVEQPEQEIKVEDIPF